VAFCAPATIAPGRDAAVPLWAGFTGPERVARAWLGRWPADHFDEAEHYQQQNGDQHYDRGGRLAPEDLGITVGHGAVEMLMRRAAIKGLPGSRRPRPKHQTPTAGDLVHRQFTRPLPDQLWVTDITEHPTREGKLYCAVVLDACTRRVVGWSIDASQTAALVTSALDMAIRNRAAALGVVIHSDHGVQFTSWAFTDRARASGLLPSMGSIGDCYDNAMIESFWSRVQVELLNQQRWRTRIELANALFEYLEIFHNRRRRHSALGMLTPIEYELRVSAAEPVA